MQSRVIKRRIQGSLSAIKGPRDSNLTSPPLPPVASRRRKRCVPAKLGASSALIRRHQANNPLTTVPSDVIRRHQRSSGCHQRSSGALIGMRRNPAHLGNLPPKLVDLISRELGRISCELGRGTLRLGAARRRAVSGAAAAAAAARRHERRVERRARLGGLLRRGGEGAVVSACMQGAGGSIATACSPAVRAITGNQGQSMEIERDRGRSREIAPAVRRRGPLAAP